MWGVRLPHQSSNPPPLPGLEADECTRKVPRAGRTHLSPSCWARDEGLDLSQRQGPYLHHPSLTQIRAKWSPLATWLERFAPLLSKATGGAITSYWGWARQAGSGRAPHGLTVRRGKLSEGLSTGGHGCLRDKNCL